jgi:hypothetical protein
MAPQFELCFGSPENAPDIHAQWDGRYSMMCGSSSGSGLSLDPDFAFEVSDDVIHHTSHTVEHFYQLFARSRSWPARSFVPVG